jgi:O-antigen ligase
MLGYYTRLNGGLLSTICYLILYYAFVNNVAPHHYRRLIFGTFLSSIFVSLYAIGEHYGHSLSCLLIKNKFDVSCWVQDVQERVFATFGQPNWLAAYNVTLISFGTLILLTKNSLKTMSKKLLPQSQNFILTRQEQIVIALAVFLNFLTLIFTKSRSGIIAFFCSLVLTLALSFWTWLKHHQLNRQKLKSLALVLLIFIIPALIWGTQYTPSLASIANQPAPSITSTPTSPTTLPPPELPANLQHVNLSITDSGEIRKIVWQGALDIWRHHPIIGTGVETFAYSYYQFRPQTHNWVSEWDFLYNKAHNEFLNFAANSGSFGLFSYLSIFVILALITIKVISRPLLPDHPSQSGYLLPQTYWLIGITSALTALSITNFFGFSTVTVQVLLFLFLALAAQIYQPSSPPLSSKKVTALWQKLSLCSLIILGFILGGQVFNTWYADYHYAKCKSNINKTNLTLTQTLQFCHQAVKLRPKEAIYQVDLADYYSQLAVGFTKTANDQALALPLAEQALNLSNNAIILNPVNINFYKTRFRTLANLALIDSQSLALAQENLEAAITLAPTDPKLAYYYSTLLEALDQNEQAQTWLDKALELRPIYTEARLHAADLAQKKGHYDDALAHYQYILNYQDSTHPTALTAVATLATISGIITSP